MLRYETHDEDESHSTLPLIDVLLIALTYFLTASAAFTQINVPVPPSRHSDSSQAPGQPDVLEIDVQGGMKLNGTHYAAAELEQELKRRRPPAVLLVAHRETPIRHVVHARDIVLLAQITKIDLATQSSNP